MSSCQCHCSRFHIFCQDTLTKKTIHVIIEKLRRVDENQSNALLSRGALAGCEASPGACQRSPKGGLFLCPSPARDGSHRHRARQWISERWSFYPSPRPPQGEGALLRVGFGSSHQTAAVGFGVSVRTLPRQRYYIAPVKGQDERETRP